MNANTSCIALPASSAIARPSPTMRLCIWYRTIPHVGHVLIADSFVKSYASSSWSASLSANLNSAVHWLDILLTTFSIALHHIEYSRNAAIDDIEPIGGFDKLAD